MDGGRAAFGEALRVAVVNRGLSLGRVQAHLGAAGHPVALSTLSQWQHGRRVPASPRSFAVVEELERVLRVPAGTLRTLLDEDASAGRAACAPVVTYDEAFGRLVEQLDPSRRRALTPLGAHDRLRIDAKGAMVQRRTTMTMRTVSGTDRHVVAHGVETGGDVDLVTVSALGGCRLGRVLRDREAEVVAVEIHFDRAQLPTRVDAFHRAHADGPDLRSHELALEHGDRVHLAQHEAAPGVHGIRWAWAG